METHKKVAGSQRGDSISAPALLQISSQHMGILPSAQGGSRVPLAGVQGFGFIRTVVQRLNCSTFGDPEIHHQ